MRGGEVGTVSARSRVAGSPRRGRCRWRRGRERGAGIAARARTWPAVALAVALIPSSVSASGGFRPAVARPGLGRLLIGRGRRGGLVSGEDGKRSLARRPRAEGSHRGTTLRRRAPSVDRVETRAHLFFLFSALGHHRELLHCDWRGEGGDASEGGGEVSAGRRAEKSQRRPPFGYPPRFFARRRAVKRVSPRSRRCTHCP